MLNKKEVAEKLQVTTRTVENWIKQGLPSYMVGRVRRFEEKEVVEWFKSMARKEKREKEELELRCLQCKLRNTCKKTGDAYLCCGYE